jgi:hypothetical protein
MIKKIGNEDSNSIQKIYLKSIIFWELTPYSPLSFIQQDDTFHNHRCENLKSYITYLLIAYILARVWSKYCSMFEYSLLSLR